MTAIDPRDVVTAVVVKATRRAGTLYREGSGTTFRYDSDYLAAGGPAVATTLPLNEAEVHSPAGSLPAFFAGLLPEGRRLTNLVSRLQVSADDELSLLLAVGQDPVGDVQVLAAEPGVSAAVPPVLVQGDFADLDFRDLLASSGIVDPTALAGVQDKVSARMLTVPLAHEGRAHLLKLDPPELPHLVENEAFFLARLRAARIPAVRAEVVRDRHGRAGMLIERFDRVERDGELHALPVEDGTQVLGLHPAQKYTVTTEQLFKAMADACAARPVAALALLRQFLHAWLTGNGDLHAKNVSLLGTEAGGEWRVSPAYDVPSTLPYGYHRLALSCGGRRDTLTRAGVGRLGETLGLPAQVVESAVSDALAAHGNLVEEAARLPFDSARAKALRRGLLARRRALEG